MKSRKRNRMKGFDYSSNNLYFVTICVKDRVCCFGEIGENIEGTKGTKGTEGTSRDLSVHCPNPNPNKKDVNQSNSKRNQNQSMQLNSFGFIVQERLVWLPKQYHYVVLHHFVVMPNHVHAVIEIDSFNVPDVGLKIKSLSELMGAFKTTSSKLIHESGFKDFKWQRSFHDHIIKNEKAYQNILHYIDKNPEKWDKNRFFESV